MRPDKLGVSLWCVVLNALLAVLFLASSSRAQTVETSQQVNDKIHAMSETARAAPHDYVIGSGDVIAISVFDVQELSREVRVSQTGSIGIPLIPVRLHVSGLTESQAEEKIAEVLEANGLVTNAQVSVSVRERKSKPITVVGAVSHPLVYQADRSVTLLEILAEAGGIANDAGDSIIVTRTALAADSAADSSGPPAIGPEQPMPPPAQSSASEARSLALSSSAPESPAQDSSAQKPVPPPSGTPAATNGPPPPLPSTPSNIITINLNQLVETGDSSNNIVLQAGDIVTVPHAGIVYVLGAVSKPGGYVISGDRAQLTTLKILALAGGLNRTAKSGRAVILRKDSLGQQHEVNVDLKKVVNRQAEDLQLQPSDILYVPNSAAKQALLRSLELGIAIGSAVALYRVAYH